jgi:hypothetical protein
MMLKKLAFTGRSKLLQNMSQNNCSHVAFNLSSLMRL